VIMHIDILTIFPEMFDGPFSHSIIKRAKAKELVIINLHNIRDYSGNKHKSVDDYPFGGEAGMVMMIEPVAQCIEMLKETTQYDDIIYLSPDGELLTQKLANQLSIARNLILIKELTKGSVNISSPAKFLSVIMCCQAVKLRQRY
jgi:tRNA (guanine37-N1)-methyltransferase